MEEQEEIDWDLMEKAVVETAVPSHMMILASYALVASGYKLRADITHYLNRSVEVVFGNLAGDPDRAVRAAKTVEHLAQKCLRSLSDGDPVHAFHASAMLTLVMVGEGLYADTTNVCVNTSMVIMEDLKTEGGVESYVYRGQALLLDAKAMLRLLQLEGFYGSIVTKPIVQSSAPPTLH